ncbi:hypothetical protein SSS_10423 [Sarcoptes scabiei]|uniref:BZIP domain-containing protein n=1 Tax=Sarcoptes scabiei TaxID=52283 RepID=A0A834R476_SARSC|nr:hypothetical protein SSS_10423 [Sarcoptes scabiei]
MFSNQTSVIRNFHWDRYYHHNHDGFAENSRPMKLDAQDSISIDTDSSSRLDDDHFDDSDGYSSHSPSPNHQILFSSSSSASFIPISMINNVHHQDCLECIPNFLRKTIDIRKRSISSTSTSTSSSSSTELKHKKDSKSLHSSAKIVKNEIYLEKRRRNNESARKSRESRRRREKETKERISILQEENIKLRTEIQILREEICRLREHEFLQSLITNSFRTIRPNDFNR